MIEKLKTPSFHPSVFIAPGAQIVGEVEIKKGASVWYNAVVRADMDRIIIGEQTNIQDSCVLHEDRGQPLVIGNQVVVGHHAVLHGAKIGDRVLVGMGAIVLNGAEIGDEAIIGAGTLIPPGRKVEPEMLIVGVPGKVVRKVTEEEKKKTLYLVEEYKKLAAFYREKFLR